MSIAAAVWSLAKGDALFDTFLLSGAFLIGASVIATAMRRPKPSIVAETAARPTIAADRQRAFEARLAAIETAAQERHRDINTRLDWLGTSIATVAGRLPPIEPAAVERARSDALQGFLDKQRPVPTKA